MTPPAVAAASRAFGVPVNTIMGPCRKRRTSYARWAAVKLLHERGLSTTQVGRPLGLDHTSVMNALRRIPELPPEWYEAFARAKALMGEHKQPAWRIVYNRPIGPPSPFRNKINCGRPNAPLKPRPPHPDDIWARKLGGTFTLSFTRASVRNALREFVVEGKSGMG